MEHDAYCMAGTLLHTCKRNNGNNLLSTGIGADPLPGGADSMLYGIP